MYHILRLPRTDNICVTLKIDSFESRLMCAWTVNGLSHVQMFQIFFTSPHHVKHCVCDDEIDRDNAVNLFSVWILDELVLMIHAVFA